MCYCDCCNKWVKDERSFQMREINDDTLFVCIQCDDYDDEELFEVIQERKEEEHIDQQIHNYFLTKGESNDQKI